MRSRPAMRGREISGDSSELSTIELLARCASCASVMLERPAMPARQRQLTIAFRKSAMRSSIDASDPEAC